MVDETVAVAKQFLEEHPKENPNPAPDWKDFSKEAGIIASFLGWKIYRVYHSLARLKLIEEHPNEAKKHS